jgi:hypothetical protein
MDEPRSVRKKPFQVIIDRAQMMQLAEALAAELDVTFGDQVPDRP